MENGVRTKEAWRSLLGTESLGALGEPPEPLVEFTHGNYWIRRTIIRFCPWCGTALPFRDPREEFSAADLIEIAVDCDGQITVNGQLVAEGETVPDAVKRIKGTSEPGNP